MKTLSLYKFVHENKIEFHWHKGNVYLFIPIYHLEQWNKLLGTHILDDGGVSCVMKEGYFVFFMQQICDHFDIDIEEIFSKKED